MTYRGGRLHGERTLCADYMRRSGQLRDVLPSPQQRSAGGDGEEEQAAPSLHALHALWNVQGEHAAEVQLASFAACSWFGPVTRVRAAQCQSTLERLRLARALHVRSTLAHSCSTYTYTARPAAAPAAHLTMLSPSYPLGPGGRGRLSSRVPKGRRGRILVPPNVDFPVFDHPGKGLTKLKQREAAKLALRQVEVLS